MEDQPTMEESQMPVNATESLEWLESAFSKEWPNLAVALKAFSSPVDPRILLSRAFDNNNADYAILRALFTTFDNQAGAFANELANAQHHAHELQVKYDAVSARSEQQVVRISELTDSLAARLLNGNASQGAASRPRRSTTDPDKFAGTNQDTAKRQAAYERWKTQVANILLIDGKCFPTLMEKLSYITSQLSGKAWDAVQDGVQAMHKDPQTPESWNWSTVDALWKFLDTRYVLLDTTQAAKNALDTLFQGKRAYGDFKADFDHHAHKAKIDDRTKVDMLRKRLSKDISSVISNQVMLPDLDDYAAWTKMTDNIARNLQQNEHIQKLSSKQATSNPTTSNPSATHQPDTSNDPMDLDRLRLSDGERKRRTDNNLCLACGEPGHFARDHHREINPVPMPPRSNGPPSRGSYRGRGRGSYFGNRGGYQAPHQSVWQWPSQPFFGFQGSGPQLPQPQLRALQQPHGFILGEAASSAASAVGDDLPGPDSPTDTNPAEQSKGKPLA